MTNRQVAEQAFVSPKTVEANLARVYRKLGIRSRAELGARMAPRPEGRTPRRRESPDVSVDPGAIASSSFQVRRSARASDTGELVMPVVLVHQGPTLTQERYEAAVRRLTAGKPSLESPSDWPVDGLLVHAAGEGSGGFRVVDLWESRGGGPTVRRDRSPTLLLELGVTDLPEVYPAHTFVSA